MLNLGVLRRSPGALAIAWIVVFGLRATAGALEARAGQGNSEAAGATGWNLAPTGGFVVSGLEDPVYALGTQSGQPTRVVIRETAQESALALGVAMFAQVYHDRWPSIAPLSFGIGIRGDNRETYYLGSAARLGGHASFTAGFAAGPVATLPPGVHEGRPVSDSNQLLNLPSRTSPSWFAGVTYTFASLR
jgi:hypothetical protein